MFNSANFVLSKVYSGAHKNAKAAGLSPKSAKRAALDARKEWPAMVDGWAFGPY